MLLPFTKMHGCGNDYIFIDCYKTRVLNPEKLAAVLSDRHRGVGGDGIVLMLPPGASIFSDAGRGAIPSQGADAGANAANQTCAETGVNVNQTCADAGMRIFNADGSEAGMCGNAIRCVAKYLYEKGAVPKRRMSIETRGGVRELFLFTADGDAPGAGFVRSVKVNMGPAEFTPEKVPVALPGPGVISRPVVIGGNPYKITCVSMGNPHAVVFTDDVDAVRLGEVGPLFERAGIFPDRVNAEFVEVSGAGSGACQPGKANRLKIRVWERGSGETMACGTGASASVAAAVANGVCGPGEDITVSLPGGELIINYTDSAIYMTGDCVTVFEGIVEV